MTAHWIVVGAGSAGCVLANRLSADGSRRVTLLDDGPDLAPGDVPAGIDEASFFDAISSPGRTHVDLVATRTAGSAPAQYLRGRGVGGSSAVNAMLGLRVGAQRAAEWDWQDVEEAWARVQIPIERADRAELGAVDRALLVADDRAERAPLTRRDGRRVTSAEAYLWPAADRENLTVRPLTQVRRILIDGRRACGVLLADGAELAADHVVLAAGAIHSPALLLASGVDTPGIGRGLQDHPAVAFTLRLRDGVEQDCGGLAIGSLLEADDLQLLPMNHLGATPATSGLALLMVALMRPTSRSGTVTLDPDGPADHAALRVDFDLLSDERDVRRLVEGVRLVRRTLAHSAFDEIVEEVHVDSVGTPLASLRDDDEIAALVRTNSADYVHASSSCAMGTVVDDAGHVIGYDALSVCDASIFPSIPDVNTHLPVTMAAERLCLDGRLWR